jgi:hypothetical protein
MTRPLAATLAAVLLCFGACACGDASKAARAPHHSDRDNDNDHNDDDSGVLGFGHAADAVEMSSLVALVKRYYAAAAAANGAQACALLVPLQAESVVEEDGRSGKLRGDSCSVVMSKLFRLNHALLAGKARAMKIIAVRIRGDTGLVAIEFPEIYEARQIGVRRVAGGWKVFDLLDGIIE